MSELTAPILTPNSNSGNAIVDVVEDIEIVGPPPNDPAIRQIATLLGDQAREMILNESNFKSMSYQECLSMMVWDLATFGEMHFADGRSMRCEDFSEWMAIVKFLANHLDGPAGKDVTAGVNIFKMYLGVDESRV